MDDAKVAFALAAFTGGVAVVLGGGGFQRFATIALVGGAFNWAGLRVLKTTGVIA